MLQLRPYQVDVTERCRDLVRRGVRRFLIQSGTGTGKTVMVAAIIASALAKQKRVLVLAHRKELIDQMYRTLVACGLLPGVIMGRDYRTRYDAFVQVASVQTLLHRELPEADVVVIDEAHRAAAKSYLKITDSYPNAVIIGCSATPERTDGRGLNDMFDEIVSAPDIAQMTEMGYLLPLRVYAPSQPDLRGVARSGGDYNQRALSRRLKDDADRLGNIPENWQRYGEGRRTIAFCASIDDSRNMAAEFLAKGIPAEHLDGDTNMKLRDEVLERLASGETLVVCQCDILVEGYDLPSLGCVILGRPTLSIIRYLQQVGRVMRPYDDQSYAIVLDHAGCVYQHGLPTDPRTWSLEGRRERAAQTEPLPPVICEECQTIRSANTQKCPKCNGTQQRAMFERAPVEVDGELVEFRSSYKCPSCDSDRVRLERASELQIKASCRACPHVSYHVDRNAAKQSAEGVRRQEYNRLRLVQLRNNYKPGWVAMQYKDLFGDWPPREWATEGTRA